MGFSWSEASLGDTHRLAVIYKLLGGDEDLLGVIFDKGSPRIHDPSMITARISDLSPTDQLRIRVSQDIWDGAGEARLSDLLDTWSSAEWTCFIQAICHLKESRTETLHALVDDENAGICL